MFVHVIKQGTRGRMLESNTGEKISSNLDIITFKNQGNQCNKQAEVFITALITVAWLVAKQYF